MKKAEARKCLSDFPKVTNTFKGNTQDWISGSLESGLNLYNMIGGDKQHIQEKLENKIVEYQVLNY